MAKMSMMTDGMTVADFNAFAEFQFQTMMLDKRNPDKILEHAEYCKRVATKHRGTNLGDMAARDAKGWVNFVDTL